MNPGVYGPLDSATNLYTGLPINRQMVSTSADKRAHEGQLMDNSGELMDSGTAFTRLNILVDKNISEIKI